MAASIFHFALIDVEKAAERLKNVRDEILTALCDIPTVLSRTQRVLAVFKKSESLHNYSSALYVAILQALTSILEYFKGKAITKVLCATVQQSSFKISLSTKVEAITQCSDAFNSEATLCCREMLKRMSQVGLNTNHLAKGVYQGLGNVTQTILAAQQEQTRTNTEIMEMMRRNAKAIARNSQTLAVLNETMTLFIASPRCFQTHSIQHRLEVEGSDSMSKGTRTRASSNRRVLMSCLSYDKDSPQVDVVANLNIALTLSLKDQDRSVHMMRSQKLVAWLSTLNSATLLVNGHCVDVHRRSPLSFVCAKLADSLQRVRHKNNVFVLQFFCGEHVRWQDDLNNTPSGIIKSLLRQLLKQCKHLDLSSATKLGHFSNNDMNAICKRSQKILTRLPRQTVVFAIVDRPSYYADDPEREEETDRLLGWLISFTKPRRKHSSGCIFKLLLTAPKRLRTSAVDELYKDEILDVPERLPTGGGFTGMQWTLGIGQQVDGMSSKSYACGHADVIYGLQRSLPNEIGTLAYRGLESELGTGHFRHRVWPCSQIS
ncbi:hypothetical protein MMC18_008672 [Xylographa bjoerkii]|nr:hypothetical protein [Xylographa bjoerkii]